MNQLHYNHYCERAREYIVTAQRRLTTATEQLDVGKAIVQEDAAMLEIADTLGDLGQAIGWLEHAQLQKKRG